MDGASEESSESTTHLTELPFPPILRSHILHCSYDYWHPLYRSSTPKARLVSLTPAFLEYLREDGIVLPDDDIDAQTTWTDQDSGIYSQDRSDSEDDDALLDPSQHFRDLHLAVKQTIQELGGKVAPKLNWSAPKDATWIVPTNSMECTSPNDVYLLLKSSDFVTHDLEHAFDGCQDDGKSTNTDDAAIKYTLVLRKWIVLNPSLEFRCFVRAGKLIGICQRDLNYFEFLFAMEDNLRTRILAFFEEKLKDTFPDENFAFDVYIPPPHNRVWLIDINPWAPRTDPLLFSWLELLQMDLGSDDNSDDADDSDSDTMGNALNTPELRLVHRDDPEAYGFNTPQYGAQKLPKDVVEASIGGPGPMRQFADQWKEIMAQQQQDQTADNEEDA
ncbi:MAG: hypothetical protein M1825_003081 [Sarcosagium campestre]|nr:MAG: hypothetical protein M1825_003081 [Sarcosagium campestre]